MKTYYREGAKQLYQARRHAKRRGATIRTFTLVEWNAKLEFYNHRCAYCGTESDELTIDHKTPLSRGGQHRDRNIAPSCLTCNRKKGNRTMKEFRCRRVGVAVQPETPVGN